MKVSDFDFDLPKELIAQHPSEKRDHSRLMVLNRDDQTIDHHHFYDLVDLLEPNSCLVLNNTKVIPARLVGIKENTDALIEVLLLKETSKNVYETMTKPARRVKMGTVIHFGGLLKMTCIGILEEGLRIFSLDYEGLLIEILEQLGSMPLPPYITEKLEDKNRYQTVYASQLGSAAAPTAGLHFTEELLKKIEEVNQDPETDGILVQLPLPKHISADKVTEKISPEKDVDGFHPINLGRMQRNLPSFLPATPYGILLMLKEYGIETEGKHCVVIGRSNIVGSPMSILMARNTNPGNCTVTVCHSRTPNIKKYSLDADILIVAIGKKNFITADMVKEGAIVIDVGMNRELSNFTKSGFKLFGDVDFENVASKASWITPVPGGVGLMTIVGLLKNTLASARKEIY